MRTNEDPWERYVGEVAFDPFSKESHWRRFYLEIEKQLRMEGWKFWIRRLIHLKALVSLIQKKKAQDSTRKFDISPTSQFKLSYESNYQQAH